ncbi:T9SS type A sorting domain-containing protein [Neolewinella lacunae]|uniref:T9SS type A sorting domain-containing protein n=1 Tax=Neolewinella lacunae TaxID=1517758 RepID=A0A923PKK4_9BACT|nr:T9SS type A sorting domain-containing protein [Neolewinella lacunae]MBC6994265.1 T9SS type A sorting domain-containing protein [Neolewinella lacunae]MDN3635798.1 T9SS type A sorting domain-containing protein [Neolewinella lacunae]
MRLAKPHLRLFLLFVLSLCTAPNAQACTCGPPEPEYLCRYYSARPWEAIIHVSALPLDTITFLHAGSGREETAYFQPILILDVLNTSSIYSIGDTLLIPVGNTAACDPELEAFQSSPEYLIVAAYLDTNRVIYQSQDTVILSSQNLLHVPGLCDMPWVPVNNGVIERAVFISGARYTIEELRAELDACALATSTEQLERTYQPSIFPNPAAEQLNIRWATPGVQEISIRNANGQQVYHQANLEGTNALELRVNDLPAGLYFVAISTKAGVLMKKVMVR